MTDAENPTEAKWLTIDESADYLKFGQQKPCQTAQDGSIPASVD